MGEVKENPMYSSNKVADIDVELSKIRVSLMEKDDLVKKLEAEIERRKESEKKLIVSLEELQVEISSLKASQDSTDEEEEDDSSSIQDFDIESLKMEIESTKLSLAQAHEEMKLVKHELKSAIDAEITSKKAMDDLVLALTEVATDCGQTKEKLLITETELESVRLESQQWKEKHEEVKKEAELLKNTSERLRIEAEESLIAWNGKESVFVNCIKRGEDEKNSLLDENDRLLEALVAAENLNKKGKEENHKVRDILKQAISEANIAKEAAVIARSENANLKDELLDKEEELEFALKELERVRVNESVANENVKKLKLLLSEIEVAMEEEKHKSLSRQDSVKEEKKKEDKKEEKKVKKEKKQQIEKKEANKEKNNGEMVTCSFSLMKLAHHNYNHNKHKEDEETKPSNANAKIAIANANAKNANANAGFNHHHNHQGSDESGEGNSSPGSDSDLFKGSIFDVAETPHAGENHNHNNHKRRSSCTFLEEVEDLENLEGNHLEEGELNDKAVARKKKAFIRRFGDLLVGRKSLSFSHKKESSTDSTDKLQNLPPTPTSPSPPQPPLSPEP